MRVSGDRDNPVYSGFTCAKGRQLPLLPEHPDRLLRSQRRTGAGEYEDVASDRCMDEIAARVERIIAEHGPRSVAIYLGTYSGTHPASAITGVGWLLGTGSRMVFTANTIDQPGKSIANALHGRWLGGGYMLHESERFLFVGTNPLVSMAGGISANPARQLREAKARGLELIVIDPRRSEVARSADLFLQPRPGEDAAILAAMLHVIFDEGLADEAFLAAETRGAAELASAVVPCTPKWAARRAGVPAGDITRAARIFSSGRRGGAIAGTGPNMSGRGNLVEYLLLCLDTVCGYWRREGERVANPGVLLPRAIPRAEAQAPRRAWGYGEKLRVRGFTGAACGLPTSALADEILLPGEGRIRALFCVGSNPVAAWPDQLKTVEAMRELDLLVTLDTRMSATSRLADYVIAPKISVEVPGVSLFLENLEQTYVGMGYPAAYGQYTPALVDPPADSDVIEEWEFFCGLAARMGTPVRLYPLRAEAGVLREGQSPVDLDPANPPTTDELIEQLTAGSRIPLAEVKRHPNGAVFDAEPVTVEPKKSDCQGHLELGDETMLSELAEVAATDVAAPGEGAFPFRLVSRRLPNVYNSSGRDLPAHLRKRSHNPAYLHPSDLASLGVEPGDVVRIESARASILGLVEAAPELRPGVVSMPHGFGDAPERDGELRTIGSSTNRLVADDRGYDPYSGIPVMSGIPVKVQPEVP